MCNFNIVYPENFILQYFPTRFSVDANTPSYPGGVKSQPVCTAWQRTQLQDGVYQRYIHKVLSKIDVLVTRPAYMENSLKVVKKRRIGLNYALEHFV